MAIKIKSASLISDLKYSKIECCCNCEFGKEGPDGLIECSNFYTEMDGRKYNEIVLHHNMCSKYKRK